MKAKTFDKKYEKFTSKLTDRIFPLTKFKAETIDIP